MAHQNGPHPTRTDDDELIDILTDWLPNLFNLGSGPILPHDFVQSHEQSRVSDEALETTNYGDHIHHITSWFNQVKSELQTDVLYESDTELVFGNIEDTLTAEQMNDPDFDSQADWNQPHVSFRLRDNRNTVPDTAPLFEVTADYYITGHTYVDIRVTPGYKANFGTAGDDRLTRESIVNGEMTDVNSKEVIRNLNERKPFVISRVHELIKSKENTRAFRRGMNPTTHSTVHHR